MSDDWIAIPIVSVIFSTIVAVIFLVTRHRERITMITKGLTPEEVKAYYTKSLTIGDSLNSLKWGILFVFVGAALLVGNFLRERYSLDDGVTFGIVCICAGCALLIFYVIASKKAQQA